VSIPTLWIKSISASIVGRHSVSPPNSVPGIRVGAHRPASRARTESIGWDGRDLELYSAYDAGEGWAGWKKEKENSARGDRQCVRKSRQNPQFGDGQPARYPNGNAFLAGRVAFPAKLYLPPPQHPQLRATIVAATGNAIDAATATGSDSEHPRAE
jgi:hypothetical protein